MTLPDAVAATMFVGVIVYAIFGGADFGSGFYDLTAGSGRSGAELRTLIDHSIGPVWEANHVWLIYILVMWWSGFPAAFAAAMTTLFVPLMLALAGIVLRGASFALRKYAATFGLARLFGAVFAGSSLITPFFFGTVVGGIASGRVPAGGYGDRVGSWINPTSLVGGALAVASCVFLAGVFLTADAARAGDSSLAGRLRRRTLTVGVLSGAIVFAGLDPVLHDAPTLSRGLLHAGFASTGAGRNRRCSNSGPAVSPKLRRKVFRRRGGRRRRRRMGGWPVPLDARRPAHHRRGRRRTRNADRTARGGRACRRSRPAAARLSAAADPIRPRRAHERRTNGPIAFVLPALIPVVGMTAASPARASTHDLRQLGA